MSGKFKAREHGGTTERKIVPVKINLYNEFHNPEFNPDDILIYNIDQNIKSMDNKGWSDWWQLKDVSSMGTTGHVYRGYARTRKNSDGKIQVEKVIFNMETPGAWVDHYTFIRNVLESLSSTSV